MLNTQVLTEVIYTAGKVFDNLRSDRLATQSFVASGDTSGISSRADLELLNDLNDAAHVIIEISKGSKYHKDQTPLTPQTIVDINSAMTRFAALHPGVFRQDSDSIGVATRYGHHCPPAVDEDALHRIIDHAAQLPPELLSQFLQLSQQIV